MTNALCLGAMSLMSLAGDGWVTSPQTHAQATAQPTAQAGGAQPVAKSASFTAADLLLTVDHGPWLIMAMAFEGEGAKTKAVQLAAELRRDFQLQAYCSPKDFDYSNQIEGAGITADGQDQKMRYRNDIVNETCAVLIGNYDSIDGADIDDTLKKVKQLRPKFFGATAGESKGSETVSVQDYRSFLRLNNSNRTAQAANSNANNADAPMRFAFKTRNPLLPAEYYKSPQVDQFVRKMNQEVPFNQFNLLDCKSKFTVRVLTLRGTDSFVSWGRSEEPSSATQSTQLEIAAEKAYLVTKTLRAAGYEAYQFHDRHQSIVCINGFDELGKELDKGRFEYTPGILEVVKRFAGTGSRVQSHFGMSDQPRLLLDDLVDSKKVPELNLPDRKAVLANFRKMSVAFDLVPTPMMVPKIEASSIYSSYTLGK